MNTVVLRRISILYDKYYQYIYRKKIETPMFNIDKQKLNVKISVAETTVSETIHAWVLSAPPINSMNSVIRLNIPYSMV